MLIFLTHGRIFVPFDGWISSKIYLQLGQINLDLFLVKITSPLELQLVLLRKLSCIFLVPPGSMKKRKMTHEKWSVILKKRLWHRCFLVNFVKSLRTPFFIEHLWWLLLLLECGWIAFEKATKSYSLSFSLISFYVIQIKKITNFCGVNKWDS